MLAAPIDGSLDQQGGRIDLITGEVCLEPGINAAPVGEMLAA